MEPKIYIDCSGTYFSNKNAGIQRTVRGVAKGIKDLQPNSAELVVFNKKGFVAVQELPSTSSLLERSRLKTSLIKTTKYMLKKMSHNPKHIGVLKNLYKKLFPKKIPSKSFVDFQPKDTLLLIDFNWTELDLAYLQQLKNRGVKIVVVLYDFIPFNQPEFCDEDYILLFKDWINSIQKVTNCFLGISKTVESDIHKFIPNAKTDYFYLGYDLPKNEKDTKDISENFKKLFQKKSYITVSTVEPRKNHQFALDVFDELWKEGKDINYIIIGKIGWKIQAFIKRIKTHKEFGKRLFLLEKIDDAHLTYAYENATALIFPSIIEGFGLPIIESLSKSLPVFASDTKIHREIGQDFLSYFSLNNKQDLKELISSPNKKDLKNFQWQSWQDSAQELIEKVAIICK